MSTRKPLITALWSARIRAPKANKSVQLRGAKNRNFDFNIFFLKYYRYIKEYLYLTYQDGFQVNFLDFWKTTFQSMMNFFTFLLWCNMHYCSPLIEICWINIFSFILDYITLNFTSIINIELKKATTGRKMQQTLAQTLKEKQKEKRPRKKLTNHKKWLGFNINTFDSQIIKGTKKEKYKATVCKQYHVRVHKGSSPFFISICWWNFKVHAK